MHATADVATCSSSGFEQEAIPHMRQLYAVALRLTRDRCDAEDLVQDTLTRAYVKFDQYTPGTSLGAWLHKILLTRFYSTCRQRSRRPAEVLTAEHDALGQPRLSVTALSAEQQALGSPGDLGDSPAGRALAQLPAGHKAVIYLADVEGYHYSEIADILGIPIGTVMSRAHRGRALLRKKLTQPRPDVAPRPARQSFPAQARQEVTRLAA